LAGGTGPAGACHEYEIKSEGLQRKINVATIFPRMGKGIDLFWLQAKGEQTLKQRGRESNAVDDPQPAA